MPRAAFRGLIAGQFDVRLFVALYGPFIFSRFRSSSTYPRRVSWSRRWERIWPLRAVFVVVGFVIGMGAQSPWLIWVSVVAALLFFGWLSPVFGSLPPGGLTIQQEMGHYLLSALLRRRGAAVLAGTVIVGYLSEVLAHAVVASTAADSIGRYSYFIYFFHFLVLRWLEQAYRETSLPSGESVTEGWNLLLTVVFFVVTTAISWLVGLLSWHLLEKRVLVIVHRTVPSLSAAN